ncbi:retropepsin-like domain-containing protein [Neiella marina]|uniref:Retropepsin-like domain-containing protein n=1 Tax=Neiella holothuriorum TaxID=2870530 RepID=A0ABS7EB60_9GAMM|nr:retropepsin-like aspartic protease [Neiella holothuriorum]MBW8189565.1 retropepsin-like domain-containing protein [Neiella holothuriorum]
MTKLTWLLVPLWMLILAGSANAEQLDPLTQIDERADQQVIVPFSFADSGHLIIEVSFNGMQPSALLIDTAAGISLLDKRTARALGLEISSSRNNIKLAGLGTKRQTMRNLDVVDLEIGMAVFPTPEFYTTDLHHIRRITANEPVVGILGTDFLVKHQGIVNYVDQTLTLNW